MLQTRALHCIYLLFKFFNYSQDFAYKIDTHVGLTYFEDLWKDITTGKIKIDNNDPEIVKFVSQNAIKVKIYIILIYQIYNNSKDHSNINDFSDFLKKLSVLSTGHSTDITTFLSKIEQAVFILYNLYRMMKRKMY